MCTKHRASYYQVSHCAFIMCTEIKLKVPRTFRAARSRCTIPRSSKYDIPYIHAMHKHVRQSINKLFYFS